MSERSDKAREMILQVLAESDRPMGADQVAAELAMRGVDLRPRSIRYYLMQMDRDGFTQLVSRRLGRMITAHGRRETDAVNVMDRVGIIGARVNSYAYRMGFELRREVGSVIMNRSLVDAHRAAGSLNEIRRVLAAGLAPSARLAMAAAGGRLGRQVVPRGELGLGTVCSVTINGILQKEGIPVASRFGGLLEMRAGQPVRFVDMIEYRGSTLDPLEIFIRAGMTRVRDVVETGNGIVGASFREVPAVAVPHINRVMSLMDRCRIGGIVAIGRPNRPLMGVPVSEGNCGLVVMGGLNPIAAVLEAGMAVEVASLAELMPYEALVDIDTLIARLP